MKDRVSKLQCPTCARRLKVKDLDPEKSIVCPKCNAKFRVDSRLLPKVVTGENDLFGPPVNRAFVDDEKFRGSDDVRAAFEDIDHLFSESVGGSTHDSAVKPASRIGSTRKRQAVSAKATTPPAVDESRSSQPATRQTENVHSWEKEKNTFSKTDERLQRNGIGLLILAAGFAFLPFVGQEVEGLNSILPYAPMAAAVVAFVGSFILTYSLRRAKLRAVVFSGLPLLLICLICLGGYFYQSRFEPSSTAENKLKPAERNEMDQVGDKINDEISIDPDSIDNNPAANFVPPRHDRPLAPNQKPANVTDIGIDAKRNNESGIRDTPPNTNNRRAAPDQPNGEHVPVLNGAARNSVNSEKRLKMQRRISNVLIKGLVNRSKLKSPNELRDNFTLSDVAGEPTVYGVALFFVEPIKGFDTAFLENRDNRTLDLIVPIVGPAEFKDSVIAENSMLLAGVNVNISTEGIVGLQGIFESEAGKARTSSHWAGRSPDQESFPSIDAGGRQVYGIVAYKKQLRTVGVALILAKDRD